MIITETKVKEIKDNVKCSQLGSINYGKWGCLREDQRLIINDLCDSWLYKSKLLDKQVKDWHELKKWLEEQEQKAWDEVSSTFDYVLNKMQELEEEKDERG